MSYTSRFMSKHMLHKVTHLYTRFIPTFCYQYLYFVKLFHWKVYIELDTVRKTPSPRVGFNHKYFIHLMFYCFGCSIKNLKMSDLSSSSATFFNCRTKSIRGFLSSITFSSSFVNQILLQIS